MIEDDIYRTSSQFRLWSYTEASLKATRDKTNEIACERVRAAQRQARSAQASATPSAAGTPQPGSDGETRKPEEKEIECLTPEEELIFVRYYCEQALDLGDTYKPPLPTMVRVSRSTKNPQHCLSLSNSLIYIIGNCNPISPPFLPHEFPNELPPKDHDGMRAVPRNKDRQLLHVPPTIRRGIPSSNNSRRGDRTRVPAHARPALHIRRQTPLPRPRRRHHGTLSHRTRTSSASSSHP